MILEYDEIEYEDIISDLCLEEDTSYEDYYGEQDENYSFSPDWSNRYYYTESWDPE